jgi:hypothetical protein
MEEKTVIKCPRCGGQKFHISVEYKHNECYIVDDNKLYKRDDSMVFATGKMGLTCKICLQDETVPDAYWEPSPEEVKILKDILMGSSFSMDITEYMKE